MFGPSGPVLRQVHGLQSFWKHSKANHTRKEYTCYEGGICISANSVEGYFANLKRVTLRVVAATLPEFLTLTSRGSVDSRGYIRPRG